MTTPFAQRIERYLARALRADGLRVLAVTRLMGGISREAWRIDTDVRANDGSPRSFVIRLDPEISLLESRASLEFAMFRAMRGIRGVPVPEAVCVEDDAAHLGAPFMVTAYVPGTADPRAILTTDYDGQGIAREMFAILGAIAKVGPKDLPADTLPEPRREEVWVRELERWEHVLQANGIGPMPVTAAAVRWLKRRPPPLPRRLCVLHGDYRLGNYLYTRQSIVAVLDWEMAHVGDPHEDLAWALCKSWHLKAAPNRIAGWLSEQEAIRIWERCSGLEVDRSALRWWGLHAHVKAAALWVTGARNFIDSSPRDTTYGVTAWRNLLKQELWMIEEIRGGSL